MKIAHVHDYSPHMIKLNKTVVTLHEAINDKKYDLAKLLANEIKITALLLENELSRLK
jgi:hypothetical protein